MAKPLSRKLNRVQNRIIGRCFIFGGFVSLSIAKADAPRDVAPNKGAVIKALRELDRQRKIAEAKHTLETHGTPKK